MTIKDEFRKNRNLKGEKPIFLEQKKARMGLAHVLYFKEKNEEMMKNYKIKEDTLLEGLNPKDKDFIYF